MADGLARWAAARAPEIVSRAEAEAVAALREALLEAALGGKQEREPAAEPALRGKPEREPAAAPPARANRVEGDALWTYCVARAGDPLPEGIPGVDGGGSSRIEAGGLSALVGRVPLAEFGAEPLRRNLNDIDWLERVARAHEAVLEGALAACTIVPLRLCTIYESEAGLQRMLEDERESLVEALELLDGRQEWGVKLLVEREKLSNAARARSDDVAALDEELAARAGGGAYMLRRRLERQVRETADALAAEVAEDVHARLQDWATDAVTRPPQNRDLSGHEGEMLLNAAYLVEAERVDGMRELVAELEELHRPLGARLELTGPWPPYNFVPQGGAAGIT
jgi:Gas vesicle synthesis protein GvpL/GvpF